MKKITIQEGKISYKKTGKKITCEPVTSSKVVAEFLRQIWPKDIEVRESFVVLALTRANTITAYNIHSTGGVAGVMVEPKLVMKFLLDNAASAVILAHNHPSGRLQPSGADRSMTEKIKSACTFFDIALLDHVILTAESYYSFGDNGDL